jgi:hypothetical protein
LSDGFLLAVLEAKYLAYCVRFQVLAAMNVKMTDFWDIAPCSLVEVDRSFRDV